MSDFVYPIRTIKAIIFILFCITVLTSKSGINPDKLKLDVKSQVDSVKSESYYQLVRYYFGQNFQTDSALKYAQLSILTAKKSNCSNALVKAQKALGMVYINTKNYDLSLKILNEGLWLAKETKQRKEIPELYKSLAYLYSQMGNIEKAVSYEIMTALEYEKSQDLKGLAYCYSHLSKYFATQS
ncbi:MAG: tetratricopeptide repeat protein, partial [Bacteroidetes bacterium]|nr:tetratricopeptide repeat protein [Bacteroidota bacterium]